MAMAAKGLTSPAGEVFRMAGAARPLASSRTCDPRIVRTKAALREALISLMEERGFDGFTVNDLCQRAWPIEARSIIISKIKTVCSRRSKTRSFGALLCFRKK